MRKIYLCGAQWCSPCQYVKNNMLKEIEEECIGQTEYVDLQESPGFIDRFRVYRIPMMCLMEDEEIVDRFSGEYPSTEHFVEWCKGERNDFSEELQRPH